MASTAGPSRQLNAATNQSSTRMINRLAPVAGRMRDNSQGNSSSSHAKNLSAIITESEPQSYSEALTSPDTEKWKAAIREELEAHEKNGTWDIVQKQPHMKEITAKWIFKIKDNSSGTGKRFKGRLVARGFSQLPDIDYKDVFAPVVRMDSVRFLFSICAQYQLQYKQLDITTAFLNGEVNEELYLTPPEGLELPPGHTCRLRRSLYGLKQAPRCWNNKFSKMLK